MHDLRATVCDYEVQKAQRPHFKHILRENKILLCFQRGIYRIASSWEVDFVQLDFVLAQNVPKLRSLRFVDYVII